LTSPPSGFPWAGLGRGFALLTPSLGCSPTRNSQRNSPGWKTLRQLGGLWYGLWIRAGILTIAFQNGGTARIDVGSALGPRPMGFGLLGSPDKAGPIRHYRAKRANFSPAGAALFLKRRSAGLWRAACGSGPGAAIAGARVWGNRRARAGHPRGYISALCGDSVQQNVRGRDPTGGTRGRACEKFCCAQCPDI
jgi:hypothetical protein